MYRLFITSLFLDVVVNTKKKIKMSGVIVTIISNENTTYDLDCVEDGVENILHKHTHTRIFEYAVRIFDVVF